MRPTPTALLPERPGTSWRPMNPRGSSHNFLTRLTKEVAGLRHLAGDTRYAASSDARGTLTAAANQLDALLRRERDVVERREAAAPSAARRVPGVTSGLTPRS